MSKSENGNAVASSAGLGVTPATEWALELFAPLRKESPVAWERCDKINATVINKIQNEAYVAGLRRAARSFIDEDYKTEVEEVIALIIAGVTPNSY